MSYLDRYMCSNKGKKALGDRKEYQLVAMTCLYIAIKLHEPLEMETSLLADLSRGCYTEMEFASMEQSILEAIDWRVSGPTPLAFVLHYLAFLPDVVPSTVVEAIFDYARYQTELGIADHSFVRSKPSVVGMAALLNAMEGMDKALLPQRFQHLLIRTIVVYTSIDLDEVEKIQIRLSNVIYSLLDETDAQKHERLLENSDDDSDDSDDDDNSVDLSDADYDDDVESDDSSSESDEETSSYDDYEEEEKEEERSKTIPPPSTKLKSPTSVMKKSRTRK